jgi:rod shape-determining protein MreC
MFPAGRREIFRIKKMSRPVAAGAISLALIVLLSLSPAASSTIKSRLLEIFSPAQTVSSRFLAALGKGAAGIGRVLKAGAHNRELEEKVASLEQEITRLKEVERENETMRSLLQFRERESWSGVAARVIGRDVRNWYQSVVIDKGGADGVKRDAAVVSPRGVIGKVIEVSPHASRVLLLIDGNSRVGGVLQTSRLGGIVQGVSASTLVINYLPRRQEIAPGEMVVTSGLGQLYPPGLPIGLITRVYAEKFGLYQYADVEPAADFDRLEQVLVIERFRP